MSQDKEGVKKAMVDNERIERVVREYNELISDDATRFLIYAREKAEMDERNRRACARSEGLEERKKRTEEKNGEKEEKEKIAQKMIREKFDVKIIKKLTGLSIEDIMNIKVR